MSFRRMRHIKAREFQGCDVAFDFSNPATLYDATSGGSLVAADGAIARANDTSGGSANATQGTSGYRPLRKVAAINGLDVARFDGSNDYLSAGDVGDYLDKPLIAYSVFKRTSGNEGGIFGKGRAGTIDGRWSILVDSAKVLCVAEPISGLASGVYNIYEPSGSTSLAIYSLVSERTAGASAAKNNVRKNGASVASGENYTETGASANTGFSLFIGAYNDSTGTAPVSPYYLNGDLGECAKFSRVFSSAEKNRLELSRARKWRIST